MKIYKTIDASVKRGVDTTVYKEGIDTRLDKYASKNVDRTIDECVKSAIDGALYVRSAYRTKKML